MKSDSELDALVAALRTDLPSERDSARLRTRLSALGLASSQALVGSAAAASATGAPGAALGAAAEVAVHAGSASWALKAGAIALVSASALGGPVWFAHDRLTSVPSTASGASVAATARASAASPQRRAASDANAALAKARSDDDRGSVRNHRATPALGGELVRPRDAAPTAGIPKTGEGSPGSPAPGANLATATEARVQPGSPSTAGFAESKGGFDSALSARAAEPTTLREETALIDRALSALRANEVSRAAALLSEHRGRFPNGLLTEERERAQRKLTEIQRPQGAH